MTDVQVGRVTPQLWPVARAVRLAMLLDAPGAFGSTFAREMAFAEHEWVERMSGNATWLAFEGELPVGSATVFAVPERPTDEAALVGMWVAAHARGRGVADALVAAVVEHARAKGLRRVTLDVADGNAAAAGLYERVGFTRTGRTGELPHSPGVSEYEMELVLR